MSGDRSRRKAPRPVVGGSHPRSTVRRPRKPYMPGMDINLDSSGFIMCLESSVLYVTVRGSSPGCGRVVPLAMMLHLQLVNLRVAPRHRSGESSDPLRDP